MIKTKIAYLLLIAVLVLFYILYIPVLSLIMLAVILSLPPLLFLFGLILKFRTKIDISIPKSVLLKGEKAKLKIKLENKSVFPLTAVKIVIRYKNTFYQYAGNRTIELSAPAKSKQSIIVELESGHCGELEIFIKKAVVYDFFKLWSFRVKCKKKVTTTFIPPMESISAVYNINESFSGESETFSKKIQGDDPSEVFKIRDYQGGDKLNRIHWKLSSKFDNLLVKEYSLPINHSVIILIELYNNSQNENGINYIDTAIDAAFAISSFLLSEEKRHYIGWTDGTSGYFHKQVIDGSDDIFDTLNMLLGSGVYTDHSHSIESFHALERIAAYSNLIYITPIIDSGVKAFFTLNDTTKKLVLNVTDSEDAPSLIGATVKNISPENLNSQLNNLII